MKKIFLTMLAIIMFITISTAATVTLIKPEGNVTLNSSEGKEITLFDLIGNIRWWKVISGGVDVINNKFQMPGNNVAIEPQYEGNQIVVIQGTNGIISPGTTAVVQGRKSIIYDCTK